MDEKKRILIYGRSNCVWCDRAKALCQERGYDFEYIDITSDPDLWAEFAFRTNNAKTVPQIFAGYRHIGGFDRFAEAETLGVIQQILGGN